MEPAIQNLGNVQLGTSTTNDRKPEDCSDEESIGKNKNSVRFYATIVFTCIGGFLFGYDTGVISGAMLLMKVQFNLTVLEQSSIVSVTIIGAWIFSLLSGWSSDRLGRKVTIFISSVVFTIGSLLMAIAYSSTFLIIGRFILGVAIGFSSSTVSVYIAEITQSHQRGTLVTTNNALTTGGQFISGLIAGLFSTYHEGWRYMVGLAAIPSTMQAIYFIFSPETPRYLLKIGREDEAYESLRSLRCNDEVTKIEFKRIKEHFEQTMSKNANEGNQISGVLEVLKQVIGSNRALRRALILGCGLQLIQQLAGINTIMYFSATILEMAGIADKSKAIWLSSITGFVNFAFTFVGLAFVERLGRRKLILISVTGVCLSLLFLSGSFYIASLNSPLVTQKNVLDKDNVCTSFSSCMNCAMSPECGFCFTKDGKNSTCLRINKNDADYSLNGWCSSGFNETLLPSPTIFATDSCPSDYSYLILLGLVFYLCLFASGLGSVPWTVNSEIFPFNYRSACFALTVSMNWLSNTVVSITFLSLIQLATESGTFLIYFGFSLIGLIYFYFELPETKGKTLEEVEKLFELSPNENIRLKTI